MSQLEEYKICKERGHVADPYAGATMNAIVGALAWQTCKYCGTEFAIKTTSEQLERNAPKESV